MGIPAEGPGMPGVDEGLDTHPRLDTSRGSAPGTGIPGIPSKRKPWALYMCPGVQSLLPAAGVWSFPRPAALAEAGTRLRCKGVLRLLSYGCSWVGAVT